MGKLTVTSKEIKSEFGNLYIIMIADRIVFGNIDDKRNKEIK